MKELKDVKDCITQHVSADIKLNSGKTLSLLAYNGFHIVISSFSDEVKKKFNLTRDIMYVNDLDQDIKNEDIIPILSHFINIYAVYEGDTNDYWSAPLDDYNIMIIHPMTFNTSNPETGYQIHKDFYAVDIIKKTENKKPGMVLYDDEKLFMLAKMGMMASNPDIASSIVDIFKLDPTDTESEETII